MDRGESLIPSDYIPARRNKKEPTSIKNPSHLTGKRGVDYDNGVSKEELVDPGFQVSALPTESKVREKELEEKRKPYA